MALKALNSVGGFSVGETPANVIYPNGYFTGNGALFSGNVAISNANANWGILTDNIYYSNGAPWDLQQAAGANTQIQFNNNNDFGASANLTFDSATNLLTVVGNIQSNNANLGNLLLANFANITANIIANNINVNLALSGNTANFTGNLTAANANLGNLVTANFVNASSNINVTDTMQAGNVRTNNLLYANGVPWDLQEAAGSNTQIQFNINNNFAASANFTYNDTTQVFAVNGNANVTNTVNTPNINAGTSTSLNLTANGYSAYLYANSNALFPGTITANAFIGNFSGNVSAAGSNTQVQFNDSNNIAGATGLTYDKTSNLVSISGNVNLGLSGQNQLVNLSNTALEVRGGWNANTNSGVNIVAGDYSNSTLWGKLAILGNYAGNAVGFAEANAFVFSNPGYGSGNVVKIDVLNPVATSNTTGVIQANGGIGVTGNGYFGGNLVVTGDIANANNISATNALNANIGNFSGNINSLNANLGNLATANFINVASNLTVNGEFSGNTANFSGNVIVPNLTVNTQLSGNTANFTGNVTAANLIGDLANGNSNVKVYANSNVEISIGGTPNIATIASTGLYVVGEINTTAGNMLSNGNVTANGFLNGANANVTGQGGFGSVVTANITAPTGNITISAVGVDQNISLVPTGNGAIDVSNKKIIQLQDPTNPKDAATKEYVDSTSQGLTIHTPVRVTSVTNLNATYANGGSVLTTIAITGGKTIQFSAAHGLSVGDELAWDNSFNNIIGDDPYFVYSTPAADTITVKAGYFGAEVTTLTNGTGLSQTARANTGVGATLTNAGANAAISIDSVALASTNRVLVQGQTNQFENGVYTVTTVGDGSTAWVLTRATTEDTYSPVSTSALGYGDYFFVQNGGSYAGSSYVVTSPIGEILFGLTNIQFSQFSAAGSYSAGNGIAITGTTISANIDGVTTDIVGGNIVVKSSANLTTPNIGDATFQSITWNNAGNGNITANNLSISNLANITGNLTVAGNVQVTYDITANANITSNNSNVNNFLIVGANITGNNITSNNLITTTNANITTNLITSNATVNLELAGNTANFTGNVIVPNLTVNVSLVGNTANFSGNLTAANANLGNLITANFANIASNAVTSNLTVNLELAGNTANFTGNINAANANLGNLATANFFTGTLINGTSNIAIPTTNGNVNITAGGNTSLVVTATGANVTGNLDVTGNFSVGNLVANNIVANNSVEIGNTEIGWGTVTTSSISANQTIAQFSVTGITGVEFLVKGMDTTGSKYSVATVTAVTDGATNTDYAVYATAQIGGATGTLVVNKTGSNLALQVTPASSNSTVWIAQYRTI